MQVKKGNQTIAPEDISKLLYVNFSSLMSAFYEMQSVFLSTRYKMHQSLETSNIIICLVRSVHLAILRQRERNLDYNVSLDNFLDNLDNISNNEIATHKIVSIVNITGIPKETVRRKLKKLMEKGIINLNKKKEYFWNLKENRRDGIKKLINNDIGALAKFTSDISKFLSLNLSQKVIKEEIESQFSFYFYHFFSCELTWLKMWQSKIKDIDLILISLQALIPTLQYFDKNHLNKISMDNLYTIVGKTDEKYKFSNTAISAASVSDVTGIPRATCIRKLDKLIKLGMLVRETKTKRYFVNQSGSLGRHKQILTKENFDFTVKIYSDFLATILNAFIRNR